MIFIKIKIFILLIFILLTIFIFNKYYIDKDKYKEILKSKMDIVIEGLSAPRGKIFDVNGKVLVDNKMINNIVFYNVKGIDIKDVSKKLANLIEFDKPSEKELIIYYKDFYNENKLLSNEEKDLINKRKINKDDILNNKIINEIKKFNNDEINLASSYSKLNNGYNYEPKVIKEDISNEMISTIIDNNIPGIVIDKSFKRDYPYNETLKGILGSVGKITKENKNEYLSKGHSLNDIVGLSYLEKYYDNYLEGTKAKYKVNNDYTLEMISEEKKGNDLYLNIDIDLQLKVDEIVKNNLIKAKNYPNTGYLSDSYVIIANPKTGGIKAISGQRYLDNNNFNDVVINNISSSFTMGSVVKGATISVGYQNNLIRKGEKIYDSCVKLNHLTEKCSWKNLGYLDSVTALEQSSNYYQFLIAISLAGKKYYPNMDLNVSEKEFNIYRNMLSSYGLGVKTGIDLPNEKIGLIGSKISPDLLLNLSIGQYDTYTPIELLAYINTIASSGSKKKPSLVDKVINNDKLIYQNDYKVVSNVDIKKEDMDLIHEGFYYVMNRGTGNGFMNKDIKPAGKTGTSESFLDTNNDGMIDASSLTLTLAGYFPYDDPIYSMVIICPNASIRNESYDYIYYLTAYISRDITNYISENMLKYSHE